MQVAAPLSEAPFGVAGRVEQEINELFVCTRRLVVDEGLHFFRVVPFKKRPVIGDATKAQQLGLFQKNTRDVLDMMRNVDIDNLSPIEALNLLAKMKKYKIHSADE